MPNLTFPFEEIPLVLADHASPTPLAIALISGAAEISYSPVHGDDGAGFEFDIESVTLASPIAGWPDVQVNWVREAMHGRQIWDLVSRSIERACTDQIFEAIDEAGEPDPDARYEARRDAAMAAE
jgi:hypothetical protein